MKKLILNYLIYYKKSIFLFGIASIIFYIVFFLYNLPLESVGYAILIYFTFFLIFLFIDFNSFYKKNKKLFELHNKKIYDLKELPFPENLIEERYTELITLLYREKSDVISKSDNEKSAMIDYYTLWAHQIKTPISAMRLLLQEENSDKNKISAELFKIEQYVEMVLSYLRMTSNSTDFMFKKYDLDKIIKQAVKKYAFQFIQKKIKLDYKEKNCKIITDEKWLLFVLEQILSNSLKYTLKGSISIYMIGNKNLVIEDTGIGIEKEDLPRIFEKGFTGYNGRVYKKSTGIGLYLSKKILTKLSHTIKVESEFGKGTRIIIGLDSIEIKHE